MRDSRSRLLTCLPAMRYDEKLAMRIRKVLSRRRGIVEKKMFGGLAFLLRGKMMCGVLGDDLVARVGPDRYEKALQHPHIRPMDFTGRPIAGYVYVATPALRTARALSKWIGECLEFAATLTAVPSRRTRSGASKRLHQAGKQTIR